MYIIHTRLFFPYDEAIGIIHVRKYIDIHMKILLSTLNNVCRRITCVYEVVVGLFHSSVPTYVPIITHYTVNSGC